MAKIIVRRKRHGRPPIGVVPNRSFRDAGRAIGKTPAQRLQWMLDFCQEEPGKASSPQRRRLNEALYVWSLLSGYQAPAFSGSPRGGAPTLSADEIAALRAEIAAGVRGVFVPSAGPRGEPPRGLSGRGWPIPVSEITRYVVRLDSGAIVSRYGGDDLSARLLWATADLLQAFGARVRRCLEPECRRWFVAVKRQTYCGPKCSQRARSRRYLKAHRDELSDRRHEAYKRRLEREHGRRLAVKRRRRRVDP
jgi:hypothetical protein